MRIMSRRVERSGARYVAQRLGLWIVFACILFWSAGEIDWIRAWGYLIATLLLEAKTLVLLARMSPETLNQRGTFGRGVKSFDKVFAVLWLLMSGCTAAVAGLDAVRFGWSRLPLWLFIPGVLVLCLADVFGTLTMLENRHFEQFVRIQKERAQSVVDTGPYKMVRHPGYLGAIVGVLVTPIILGSARAYIPAGLLVLIFVVRTYLEDRTLMDELQGYKEYSKRTRFRLIPLVW